MRIGRTPPVGLRALYGSYIGNDTVNRAIPHGCGSIPRIIFLFCHNNAYWSRIMEGYASVLTDTGASQEVQPVTAPDAVNFYVGNAADYNQSVNFAANTYYWVTFG